MTDESKIPFETEMPESSKEKTPEILEKSDIIKVPHRFNIMLLLYTHNKIGFTVLRKLLHLTPGNLEHHLSVLKNNGWVKERTVFSFRPLLVIEITETGKISFQTQALKLKQLLDNIE